jgi:hypothetical protein
MIGMMDTGMKIAVAVTVIVAIGAVFAAAKWLKRR